MPLALNSGFFKPRVDCAMPFGNTNLRHATHDCAVRRDTLPPTGSTRFRDARPALRSPTLRDFGDGSAEKVCSRWSTRASRPGRTQPLPKPDRTPLPVARLGPGAGSRSAKGEDRAAFVDSPSAQPGLSLLKISVFHFRLVMPLFGQNNNEEQCPEAEDGKITRYFSRG